MASLRVRIAAVFAAFDSIICEKRSARSSVRKDLHVDPVRVLDVRAGIGGILRIPITLQKRAADSLLKRGTDCEVIDDSGRALRVDRERVHAEAK
jgi:hypothetical protein